MLNICALNTGRPTYSDVLQTNLLYWYIIRIYYRMHKIW